MLVGASAGTLLPGMGARLGCKPLVGPRALAGPRDGVRAVLGPAPGPRYPREGAGARIDGAGARGFWPGAEDGDEKAGPRRVLGEGAMPAEEKAELGLCFVFHKWCQHHSVGLQGRDMVAVQV